MGKIVAEASDQALGGFRNEVVPVDLCQPSEESIMQKSIDYWFEQLSTDPNLTDYTPRAFLYDGRYYIIDGNTRVYLKYKEGAENVEMIVSDYDVDDDDHKEIMGLAIIAMAEGITHVRDLESRII